MEEIVLKAITHKELSRQEKELLDNWLKESQKNRMIFNQLKLTLKYPDEDRVSEMKVEGLNRLKRVISSDFNQSINSNKRNSRTVQILKLAATIVLIISASLVIYRYQEDSSPPIEQAVRLIEKTSLPGQKITVTLSDGTIVKLNSDSKIIVPDHFANDVRQVELIGEAFFDVNRDTSRPFIIKTNDLKVEVLGTSFNLRSYSNSRNSLVAVKTGKVAVNKISGTEKIYLEPNEMVSLKGNGDFSKRQIVNNDLVFGWTDQRLVFDETSLEDVFEQMDRWFGVEIVVERDIINKRPYTASYKNPTLEEVFKSLSHLYQFNYKKDGNRIIVR
ncbi:MAG: FecR domain-containing protein [Cyclobacteriaceae bacterium]|nr:FecR domain-containing protein [Cyclobacteriaceae bacterium SS2]